jgi:hypothetical protein
MKINTSNSAMERLEEDCLTSKERLNFFVEIRSKISRIIKSYK